MSIRSWITARLHAIGDGFDRYFAPWAADVQRAGAHRAEIKRIQAEQDESYAQAMARMTGADPAAFEPGPPAGRTMTDIVNDRNAGRIGWAEYNRQEQARAAELDDEAAFEAEVRGAPQLDLTGADPAAFEPEPDRAEAEAALQAGEEEFADYWSGEGQDARRDLGAEDSDPDWVDPEAGLMYGDTFYWTQPTSAGHAATREQQGDWATLPDDLQAQYLGDRAAEMAAAPDHLPMREVVDRMGRDGVPGAQVAEAAQTALLWRQNEATAEAVDAEVRHTAEELSRERGELIWPDQVARAQERARAEVARQAAAEREAAEWRDRNAEADPYANRDLRGEAETAADSEAGQGFEAAAQEEEMTDEEAWQFRMEQKLEELEAAARPVAEADPGFTVPEDTGWGDEPLPRGFMGAPVPEDADREPGAASSWDEPLPPSVVASLDQGYAAKRDGAQNWDGRICADMTGSWIESPAAAREADREADGGFEMGQ